MIFLAVKQALEESVNLRFIKLYGRKMAEKGPKENIDQIVRTPVTQNNAQWVFHFSQELYDISYQTNTKDFQSHGNN